MSEIINRGVEALKRLPVRDRDNPGSELDELRLREAVRAVIGSMRGAGTVAMFQALYDGNPDKPVGEKWDAMIDASLT